MNKRLNYLNKENKMSQKRILNIFLITGVFLVACAQTGDKQPIAKTETQVIKTASEENVSSTVAVPIPTSVDTTPAWMKWIPIEGGYFSQDLKDFAIAPKFLSGEPFAKNGLAAVKQNNKTGFINTQGQLVIPAKYEWANNFTDNELALVKDFDGKSGFVNNQGKMLFSEAYAYNFSYGLSVIKVGNKWGYMNEQGKRVIPPSFEWAGDFATNGLAVVQKGGKYGFINQQGTLVIPAIYDAAHSFSAEGSDGRLAKVKLNNKIGMINQAGDAVVPLAYEYIDYPATNGLALFKKDGKYGYVNSKGVIVIQPQYRAAGSFSDSGLADVYIDNNCGYINSKGKQVIGLNFNVCSHFVGNSAWVMKGGKVAFINETGKTLTPFIYESVASFPEYGLWKTTISKEKDDWGYVDHLGRWVVKVETVNQVKVIKNADDKVIWSANLTDEKYTQSGVVKIGGLMWMRCSIGQTWTGKTCTGKPKGFERSDAVRQTADYAGYSDWRPPSVAELNALIRCPNGRSKLDSDEYGKCTGERGKFGSEVWRHGYGDKVYCSKSGPCLSALIDSVNFPETPLGDYWTYETSGTWFNYVSFIDGDSQGGQNNRAFARGGVFLRMVRDDFSDKVQVPESAFDIRVKVSAKKSDPSSLKHDIGIMQFDSVDTSNQIHMSYAISPKAKKANFKNRNIVLVLNVVIDKQVDIAAFGIGVTQNQPEFKMLKIPLKKANGYTAKGSQQLFDIQTFSKAMGTSMQVSNVKPKVSLKAIYYE